jgi:hypothetical protein
MGKGAAMPRDISLYDANPALARAVWGHGPRELGRRAILPVVIVREGAAAADDAGPGVIALIVVGGLLVSDERTVAGPGDVIADAGAGWTACTPARLALIGPRFLALACDEDGAAAALVSAATTRRAEPGDGGPLEVRLLDLLWRLAGSWGALDAAGMTLPLRLEAGGLARLLLASEGAVTAELNDLQEHHAVTRREGGWRLAPAGAGRRDRMRARTARQLAAARQTIADCHAVFDLLQDDHG